MKKVEAFVRHEAFEPIRMDLLDKGFIANRRDQEWQGAHQAGLHIRQAKAFHDLRQEVDDAISRVGNAEAGSPQGNDPRIFQHLQNGKIMHCLSLSPFGGLAVDVSNAVSQRTQLQLTADSTAHVALYVRNETLTATADEAKAAALALSDLNMPDGLYGDVLTASDIEFGVWDLYRLGWSEDNNATRQYLEFGRDVRNLASSLDIREKISATAQSGTNH